MASRIVIVETLTSGAGLELVAAALRTGLPVTFVTRDRQRYAADRLRPLLDDPTLDVRVAETRSAERLAKVFDTLPPDLLLLTPNESFLPYAAEAAERAGIAYLSRRTVELAHDKLAFRRACAEAGIPAPASTPVADLAAARQAVAEIGHAVLKPSVGTGSYGVVAVADPSEVESVYPGVRAEAEAMGGTVLVEEYAIGPVVSAEVIVAAGRTHVLGISDRVLSPLPHFLELAIRFPVRLGAATTAAIEAACRDLVKLLEFDGAAAHIEFALTADGPRVIEFNPRMAGGNVFRLVSAALGWNAFDAVIDALLGRDITVPRPVGGAAEQSLYATTTGVFDGVLGLDLAGRVPGFQELTVNLRPGTPLGAAVDQRAEYGTVWCIGATAEEAGLRAAAAANCLRPQLS